MTTKDAYDVDGQNFVLLLVVTQVFAALVGALSVVASILVDAATNRPVPRILVVNAACTLPWSLAALAIIQSESDSSSTILNSCASHVDKYSPLVLVRILQANRLRWNTNRGASEMTSASSLL